MQEFNNQRNIYYKNQSGFTMLFAILVSSMLLIVGMSIFNISLKELILSSSAKDSQMAYYSASAGLDCLFYNGIILGKFDAIAGEERISNIEIKCGDKISTPFTLNRNSELPLPSELSDGNSTQILSKNDDVSSPFFFLDSNNTTGQCFTVRIAKKWQNEVETTGTPPDTTTENIIIEDSEGTIISIRGYNTCDATDNARVERGLYIEY